MKKYSLDAEQNLVPGEDLTFVYQGSGVATFIDGVGTGYRIPIGVRNLAGVDADGTVHLEEEPAPAAPVAEQPEDAEKTDERAPAPEQANPPLKGLSRAELRNLCRERGIEVKGNPKESTLIALLEDAD
jgi:hypothetical protein